MPNTGRFRRVDRCIHRHVRSGELWFVGRRDGRVRWQRLRTYDLKVARSAVAMLDSKTNGNTAIFLVVDGKEQLLPETAPAVPAEPLPRVRQVVVPAETPTAPATAQSAAPAASAKLQPAAPPASASSVPTLDDLLTRWRRGKAGLKPATEAKLDDYLKMTRRYVDTKRPVPDYKPQDIRDFLAKARADKDEQGRKRLKGQTINEAIWRPLNDAFGLALEEGYIDRNPMPLVKREKTEPIQRTQHTWEDAERILQDVKARAPESYLQLKFMLFLGVGQAEAKAVTGGSFNWQAKEIRFIRKKTGKPYEVPFYPWAEDFLLKEVQPRLRPEKPLFEWRNPRKALETACLNLGLASVDVRSLRRTLIIHLLQQGTEVRLIAEWQGHRDASLILSRYGKYIDADHKKQALAKLAAAVGR